MSDDELVSAMVAEPTLIRRPLVACGDDLVVGFSRRELAALLGRPVE
jgi:arsenate reductase-like glutaredoxin family protein